jgi:DamX protein
MVERTLISLPSQLQLIERLQHLIYLSSSLIFVSGEAGSGKSTLTETLSNSLNNDVQEIYISLASEATVDKLRQQIIAQLYELPLFNDQDKLIDTVLRLQASESKSANKLLIIDNAHYLPNDFIIELCELFSADDFIRESTFNILLLADEDSIQQQLSYIDANLISSMQSALNHVEFKLTPLNTQESLSLLNHNFKQMAYQAEPQLQDALSHQLKQCRGNPQKIIQLATDLSQGTIKPERNYWLKTALPAISLMSLLVVAVSYFATRFYPQFLATTFMNNNIEVNHVEVGAVNENDNKSIEIEQVAQDDSVVKEMLDATLFGSNNQQETLAGSWSKVNPDITDNNQEVGLSDQEGQRVVLTDEQLFELNVFNETNDLGTVAVNKPEKPTTSAIESVNLGTDNSQQGEDNGSLLSALRGEINSNKEEVVPSSATIQPTVKVNKPSSPVVETPVVNVIKDKAVTVKNSGVEKAALVNTKATVNNKPALPLNSLSTDPEFTPAAIILAKSPDHYTLQLSGMASKRYLSLFKQEYNFPQENLFLYQTLYQNKPWFVVLYGEYDSIESAQLAAKNLPPEFKNMPNWVKKWQVVHNELRLNNE